MGELATVAGSWLDRIESSRQGLIEAAKSGNRVLAAFAQADARAELIASLKDEQIQARLLRITDPELDMVELVNSPTDQDRVRVCAIAILSGFVPGDAQFSIYGGGRDKQGKSRPGKLYTKEAGYRTLFGHLGIVPELSTQHPEWKEYGGGGKKCWAVPGRVSCVYQGQTYIDECYGEDAVRIDGYETDKAPAVAAKARRRLLQMLWSKLSPILNEPQPDDDVEQVEPIRIESSAAQETQSAKSPQELRDEMIRLAVCCKTDKTKCWNMLKKDPSAASAFEEIWKAYRDAATQSELDEKHTAYETLYNSFRDDVRKALDEWLRFREYEVKYGKVEAAS